MPGNTVSCNSAVSGFGVFDLFYTRNSISKAQKNLVFFLKIVLIQFLTTIKFSFWTSTGISWNLFWKFFGGNFWCRSIYPSFGHFNFCWIRFVIYSSALFCNAYS